MLKAGQSARIDSAVFGNSEIPWELGCGCAVAEIVTGNPVKPVYDSPTWYLSQLMKKIFESEKVGCREPC